MKRFKLSMLLLAALLFAVGQVVGQDVVGKWKTIDDESGNQKSIVQLWMIGGKLYGKVVELKPGEDPNKVCTECTDSRKGQKIVGMQIISGLSKEDDVWEGDDAIMDPENGKLYDCKIWVEDGKLQVRGYIGFFFRTQTWIRVS